MLDLKVVGWGPPSNPSARRVELFADWIEAQALIAGIGQSVQMTEFADRLTDNAMVRTEDEAWTLITDVKKCCRRRQRHLGQNYPFAVAGDSIGYANPDRLIYAFCLLISLPEQFTTLRTGLDARFREIFEEIVVAAMARGMPDWTVYSTGWAALAGDDNAKKKAQS